MASQAADPDFAAQPLPAADPSAHRPSRTAARASSSRWRARATRRWPFCARRRPGDAAAPAGQTVLVVLNFARKGELEGLHLQLQRRGAAGRHIPGDRAAERRGCRRR
ncbi:MAG: hypothetical protein V9H69_07560 [Anaerolineae bacterium]